jgi:hypothetical protein
MNTNVILMKPTSRWNPAWRTVCLLFALWLSPATVSAEAIPALLAVPAGLNPKVQSRLVRERASLEQERQVFLEDARRFNTRPAEAQTDAEFAALGQRRATHISRTVAFNREVVAASAESKASAGQEAAICRLGEMRGEVHVIAPDDHEIAPATAAGMPLMLNSQIRTGADGHVTLKFPDASSVTLGPRTTFYLDVDTNTTSKGIIARIRQGIMKFIRPYQPGHAESLRIGVPTAICAVRGTELEANVEPDGTGYVKLFTGKLDITGTKTGATFPLEAGQMVTLNADGTIGRPVPLKQ